MKVLGTVQFQQKKFKTLPLTGRFKNTLGNIPYHFMAIIYGDSGNGKTECCIQLAKDLTAFGKVAWLSYEQGHGFDLQTAVNRNKMEDVSGNFLIIDPVSDLPHGTTFLQDLDKYLAKRNSPEFIFIDSVDYTRFDFADYEVLKTKYGHRKTFIWISHANGNKPQKRVATQILYDGGIGIFVKNFIATVIKNRFGGFTDYIIYEKMARERNPLYFKTATSLGQSSNEQSGKEPQKNSPEQRAMGKKPVLDSPKPESPKLEAKKTAHTPQATSLKLAINA
jgi:hypothetical protein